MYKLKTENTNVEVEFTIDSKEWEEGVEKTYEASKSKFNVQGFRKGHAPRKVIEKEYGDSVFFEDTVNYFVNKTMDDVLNEHPDYEPVTMPKTQFESFTRDSGLKMKIMFEIVPDFEMCKYTGVTIKMHEHKVTEVDIEHEISHLLQDNASFVSVDREVRDGDNAIIDFMGFLGDTAFDGGTAKDYPLQIGSGTFIDNFEEQLIGHKKGEIVDVNVTFPENYPAEDLKGQKVTFKVTIKDVRERHLPEFNDKFVSDTTEYETVEEYRKATTAHIQSERARGEEVEFNCNMRDYLIENTDIKIPDEMIEIHVQDDINHMREALKAYNMTLEDYIVQTGGTNLADYIKEAKERVLRSTKCRYLYRKIIAQENITVPAEELAEATKGITDQREIIKKENELVLQKMYKFLRDNNKTEIVPED